jgi:hypothetical protein
MTFQVCPRLSVILGCKGAAGRGHPAASLPKESSAQLEISGLGDRKPKTLKASTPGYRAARVALAPLVILMVPARSILLVELDQCHISEGQIAIVWLLAALQMPDGRAAQEAPPRGRPLVLTGPCCQSASAGRVRTAQAPRVPRPSPSLSLYPGIPARG